MNIMFVCTDNFTRSVIAEFCMKDFLRRNNKTTFIKVASAGIRANSDISKYSNIHFNIMMYFKEYDIIIAMSELHRDYIKEQYNREIPLFNEVYNGQKTTVNIGAPDSEDFVEQMNKLVHYFYEATPSIIRNIEQKTVL